MKVKSIFLILSISLLLISCSKKEVKIKIHQANITGNGFTMKNHGKYIKIFGKAKLISKNYD